MFLTVVRLVTLSLLVLVLGVVFHQSVSGQANCRRECQHISASGEREPTFRCWKYTNPVNGTSCHDCGGGPGNGFCVDGDPNLTCRAKTPVYKFKNCKSGECTLRCGLATAGRQEAVCNDVEGVEMDETLRLCELPATGVPRRRE